MSEDTKNKVIIGTKGVKYGLQRTNFSKTSVFGDDDDDNENEKIEGPIDFKKKVFEEAAKPNRQLKIQTEIAKTLGDDPLAFEYDAVYDEMKKQTSSFPQQENRQPKYIKSLMQTAEVRKRERDIIFANQLQKQLEIEKEIYGETEKFLTASYKKKLQENKAWLEEQQRKEEADKIHQVTGKKDLTDFYANLLTNNIAFGTAQTKLENNQNNQKATTTTTSTSTSTSTSTTTSASVSTSTLSKDSEHQQYDRASPRHHDSRHRSRSRSPSTSRSSTSRGRSPRREYHREKQHSTERSRRRSRERSRSQRESPSRGEKRKRSESPQSHSKSEEHHNENNVTTQNNKEHSVQNQDVSKEVQTQQPQSSSTQDQSQKESEKAKYARRNDEASIAAARERYFQRLAARKTNQ